LAVDPVDGALTYVIALLLPPLAKNTLCYPSAILTVLRQVHVHPHPPFLKKRLFRLYKCAPEHILERKSFYWCAVGQIGFLITFLISGLLFGLLSRRMQSGVINIVVFTGGFAIPYFANVALAYRNVFGH
jgi:hypothetical protein